MALFFTQLLTGIQNGAVYASLAIALVLIFRTTGILNFAQGEVALYSTYVVWWLTTKSVPVSLPTFPAHGVALRGGPRGTPSRRPSVGASAPPQVRRRTAP